MTDKNKSVLEDTKKQTAVEWLYMELFPNKIDILIKSELDIINEVFAKAKELEKKQIEDAFETGADDIYYAGNKFEDGEEFYKETYGQ